MRIDTAIRFKCDDCATETARPDGWVTIVPLRPRERMMKPDGSYACVDLCEACAQKLPQMQRHIRPAPLKVTDYDPFEGCIGDE